jgi:uncharacterized membrane protein
MDTNGFPPDGFRGGMIQVGGHAADGSHNLLWVIFAVLLVVLLIALISLVLSEYHRSKAQQASADDVPGPPGGALGVLDTRYASGELTRRDYLQARKDILGPGAAAAP